MADDRYCYDNPDPSANLETETDSETVEEAVEYEASGTNQTSNALPALGLYRMAVNEAVEQVEGEIADESQAERNGNRHVYLASLLYGLWEEVEEGCSQNYATCEGH